MNIKSRKKIFCKVRCWETHTERLNLKIDIKWKIFLSKKFLSKWASTSLFCWQQVVEIASFHFEPHIALNLTLSWMNNIAYHYYNIMNKQIKSTRWLVLWTLKIHFFFFHFGTFLSWPTSTCCSHKVKLVNTTRYSLVPKNVVAKSCSYQRHHNIWRERVCIDFKSFLEITRLQKYK